MMESESSRDLPEKLKKDLHSISKLNGIYYFPNHTPPYLILFYKIDMLLLDLP